MTLSLTLLGVSAVAVILAFVHVHRTNAQLTEIRDLLVEIRDSFE